MNDIVLLPGDGVGPEVLVGLCVERSVDLIVSVLGILKAGGAWLPLDAAHPAERLAFMLQDSSAAADWKALMKEHDASKSGYWKTAAAFAPRFRAFAEKHQASTVTMSAIVCIT